jgi:hypothetical protein
LCDARFCIAAMDGIGVIAFHDSLVVKPAIDAFVKEAWKETSYALNFGGGVFAVEFGGLQILTQPLVQRAIGSKWHALLWRAANRYRRSSLPFRFAWSAIPAIDVTVLRARRALRQQCADERT